MKIRFPNPFVRRVRVSYYRAEALCSYRKGNTRISFVAWYDAFDRDAALAGLKQERLKRSVNTKLHRHYGVSLRKDTVPIPFYRLAYWWPPAVPYYMLKRGFSCGS